MTPGSDRSTKAVATFIAVLAAALGADAGIARAAGDRAPKRATNSLTTQFPLGRQRLCCTSKPRRHATKPARHPRPVSQTASVTSSIAAAAPPRSRTASQPPLLGQRGGSVAAPLIVIGVLIVGGAAALQMCRLSVRRRRRARRMARAGPATPAPPPAVPSPDTAPRPAAPRPAAPRPAAPRTDADVAGPAPIEWRRVRSRVRSRAPLEPVPQSPPAVADAPSSDVADDEVVADPLVRLEREILKRGAAASAAAASRRSPPGDGAYRLGQILYERGRLDEAAAAWRLAASKQHAKAVARLAELEETGGTDAHG
jgi:hypothetical protein